MFLMNLINFVWHIFPPFKIYTKYAQVLEWNLLMVDIDLLINNLQVPTCATIQIYNEEYIWVVELFNKLSISIERWTPWMWWGILSCYEASFTWNKPEAYFIKFVTCCTTYGHCHAIQEYTKNVYYLLYRYLLKMICHLFIQEINQ